MSDILYNEIPSLDLADFRSGDAERKAAFTAELGKAFENIGFVAIRNHGLSEEDRLQLYTNIEKFFALPEDLKRRYENEELQGQRGYIGKNKEQAKDHYTPDLKEFIQIGQEFNSEDLSREPVLKEYPRNIWFEEVPELRKLGVKTYQTLEAAGVDLLRAIALHLGLEENYFDDKVRRGNSILRPIHYYPIPEPDKVPEGAVRSAEHGDINLITLLMGASAEGLQVLRRDDKWIPVTALPEQLVVNVGDMLSRHTNNVLKSTIHRVVNPPREKMNTPRYSVPFFMHPRSDMDLSVLPHCISEENPKRFEDISAGDFLQERLSEIGFAKK